MRKFTLFVAVAIYLTAFNPLFATVKGVVTDQNNRGVENVVITDGFEIYRSEADGSFLFEPHKRTRFIYMTTPNGYEQVGEFWQRFEPSSDSLYIFRIRSSFNESRNFVHIGDTEARIHKDWVDVLKEYVEFNKPSFVMFNGDICYENGLKLHARELTSANLGVRTLFSLGNHDLVDGAYGEELYEQLFGPVWYSFDNGGVHFVVIPVLYGDRKPSFSADDLYLWLKKDLDAIPKGMPVILFNHHFTGYESDFLLKGDSVEINLLDYNLKAYFYAHYHVNLMEHSQHTGVTTIATMSPNKGGIDHTPSSFRVVSFDRDGNLNSNIRYASLKGHLAATLYEESSSYQIVANLFDTRADARMVTVQWQGSEYPLQKVSDWSWRASLPTDKLQPAQEGGRGAVVTARFTNGAVVKSLVRDYSDIGAAYMGTKSIEAPKVKWVASLGNHIFMTSPIVTEGLVITATFDDNGKGGSAIHALSATNGKPVWRLPVINSIKNNMALWEGTLLACDVLGNLYAVEVATGELLWSRALRGKRLHPIYTQGVTAHNGVVYAGHGDYLTALNIESGEILWKNSAWSGGVCTVASPVVEPQSGVLLTAGYWSGRFAHDATTGKLLWEKRDDDTRIADNSPVHYKGSLFYLSPGYIMEVEPKGGRELLKHKIDYVINNNSRPVVTDNLLIVGTTNKGVVAFDRLNNYKELWNFKTNPGLIYTAPYTKDFQMTVESGVVLVEGDSKEGGVPSVEGDSKESIVYFGANDGYLYSLNGLNGVFRWRMNLGAPILGNVIVEKGTLYVNDFAGNLWSIKL